MKIYDVDVAKQTESWLGPEFMVFQEGSTILRWMIDAVVSCSVPPSDHATKAQLAIADRGFFLLWSGWNEALAARYTSTIDHLRSLFESVDFIYAISIDPSAGERWLEGKLSIDRARGIVKSYMRDNGRYDMGKSWENMRRQSQKELEAFSHVSKESCLAFMAYEEDPKSGVLMYKPRGASSVSLARSLAVILAADAVELIKASAIAFRSWGTVPEIWRQYGNDFVVRAIPALEIEYSNLGLGHGSSLFNTPAAYSTGVKL